MKSELAKPDEIRVVENSGQYICLMLWWCLVVLFCRRRTVRQAVRRKSRAIFRWSVRYPTVIMMNGDQAQRFICVRHDFSHSYLVWVSSRPYVKWRIMKWRIANFFFRSSHNSDIKSTTSFHGRKYFLLKLQLPRLLQFLCRRLIYELYTTSVRSYLMGFSSLSLKANFINCFSSTY